MNQRTMGDPCPTCGGTEYYCAKEVDKLTDWLAVWHDDLVASLAIMDKGKFIPNNSVALWTDDHDRLRHNLLSIKDSIDEQLENLADPV